MGGGLSERWGFERNGSGFVWQGIEMEEDWNDQVPNGLLSTFAGCPTLMTPIPRASSPDTWAMKQQGGQ